MALSRSRLASHRSAKSKKSYLAELIPHEAGGRRSSGFAADGRRRDVGEWNVRGDSANQLARVEFGAGPHPRRVLLDGLGRPDSRDGRPGVLRGPCSRARPGDSLHGPTVLAAATVDLSNRRRRRLPSPGHRTPPPPPPRPPGTTPASA